ncbi:protein-tyrosine phosphatase family protein [Pontiella agarivorans]|uniref:Protein-tyrosine phosphatase family protein n=1 Tax=Pontiella agarivorans TaxID=3038953 RepID=A0ABU5MZ30_9BACT|nr:protein-tyrosine phosphatase family protein [Pontiella agarivorans]MDZ8119432.1 protein-tyrosine phosphatase family protein [Pontiella agarivorans]
MNPLRKVKLDLPGALYLHSMPGKKEPLAECFQALEKASVDYIVCLNPMEEIQAKSPDYAEAVKNNTLPCGFIHFPIGNGGVPEDTKAFLNLARETAEQLKNGSSFMIHCKGGVGRTGTLASCIVAALGQSLTLVTDAGGKAESEQQRKLIASL